MGKNFIRKYIVEQTKWTDKSAPKHKHIYNTHAVCVITYKDTLHSYVDIMKCQHCNSFKAIGKPEQGNALGYILDEADVDFSLPKVYLYTTHPNKIGYKDAMLKR